MREKQEAIEIICPKCKYTSIVYSPKEDIPKCPDCKRQMVIRELLDEGKLKMAPKGFPKDFSDVDLLKYKSYIVSHSISDNDMTGKQGRNILSKAIQTVKPLNDFINRGLDAEDEEIIL